MFVCLKNKDMSLTMFPRHDDRRVLGTHAAWERRCCPCLLLAVGFLAGQGLPRPSAFSFGVVLKRQLLVGVGRACSPGLAGRQQRSAGRARNDGAIALPPREHPLRALSAGSFGRRPAAPPQSAPSRLSLSGRPALSEEQIRPRKGQMRWLSQQNEVTPQ